MYEFEYEVWVAKRIVVTASNQRQAKVDATEKAFEEFGNALMDVDAELVGVSKDRRPVDEWPLS